MLSGVEAVYFCRNGFISDTLINELKSLVSDSWATLPVENYRNWLGQSFWRLHTHVNLGGDQVQSPFFAVFNNDKKFVKVQEKLGPDNFKDCDKH